MYDVQGFSCRRIDQRPYDPGSELSETCDTSRPELLRRRILQLRSYYIEIKSALTISRGILLYKPLAEAREIHREIFTLRMDPELCNFVPRVGNRKS